MDALRPTAANVARIHVGASQLKDPLPTRRQKGDVVIVAEENTTLTVKPSPNSFAPVHPHNAANNIGVVPSPSKAVLRSLPSSSASSTSSPRRGPSESASTTASALPAFLSRRPTQTVVATESSLTPLQPTHLPRPVHDDSDLDDDDDEELHALPVATSSGGGGLLPDDGGDLVDEALFEECLDLDEEEQTEDDLKAIAEDLSATTGLSHAEVLELLLEQQREKQAMRRAKLAAKKDADTMRALVRRTTGPAAAEDEERRDDGSTLFVTATPDLVRGAPSSAAAYPQSQQQQRTASIPPPLPLPRKVVPSSIPPLNVDADDEDINNGGGQQEESSARRMKRQLAELFPTMSTSQSSNNAKDDEFVDLQTYRAQRAAKQHAAVANHLKQKRGSVEMPKSLETRDIFVKAYEGEMRKRRAAREEKEQMAQRKKEEEDKERRMKGFFSNETIRKNIEDTKQKTATLKQQQQQQIKDLATPTSGTSRMRSSSKPSK